LGPIDKATAWLSYRADHRETDDDLECLIYLSSRGHSIDRHVQQLRAEWKLAESDSFEQYQQRTATTADDGPVTVEDFSTKSSFAWPNFWEGHHYTIDATMLRTVEWCRIAGFKRWWKRLAQEIRDDALDGGFGNALWLFAMCRSDLAQSMLSIPLRRAFENLTSPRFLAPLPWQIEREGRRGCAIVDDIRHASAIVFAEHCLCSSLRLTTEAVETLQQHFSEGFWSAFTDKVKPSVEATAMAMHALGVARPRGWEHVLSQASEWLLSAQHDDGYWEQSGTPDAAYLTVLVMDAINLAREDPGPLTWRLTHATHLGECLERTRDASPPAEANLTRAQPEVVIRLNIAEQRKAAVDAYIEEVFLKTGKRIHRTDIWTAAKYKDATEFQRWQRKDPRTTPTAEKAFARILSTKPHLK
jgi:hypothetical protein